jgi:hypothetical protein
MGTRVIKKLGVRYDLWGEDPVHALGEIGGREFQFRASAGEWELQIAGYHGLPPDGDHTGYAYCGKFSGPAIAHEEAASLVESCLQEHAAATD